MKLTKDFLLLIILIIIDIILIISFINGTIILDSVFRIIGFVAVMVFVNWFVLKLIEMLYSMRYLVTIILMVVAMIAWLLFFVFHINIIIPISVNVLQILWFIITIKPKA